MYEHFAVTLGESFMDSVRSFRSNAEYLSKGDSMYREGYLMALHRMFTLIEQAAETCEIPLAALGLEGVKEEDFFR